MAEAIPVFRSATVRGPGGTKTLVELSVAPPTLGAIAIVLDLSDSCSPMREELRRLPRLLETVARQTPVWIYRVSSTRPVVSERTTVAHLVDGTVPAERWLDERSIVADARVRGS